MVKILGIDVYDEPLDHALSSIIDTCTSGAPRLNRLVSATGAHGLVHAKRNPVFADTLRTFDAIDTMNNLYADTKLRPKVLIADVDTYQKWPHDDLFPGIPVNYLKMDRVPGPDEDWGPIMKALSEGNFFGTTGEVFIRNYAVQGSGAKRTIVADVDYTFPLEFVEVVWGDGQKIDRQIIRATEVTPMGTKHFAIPFDAAGKKWVRFAAWDSAVNGAFVQPIWLHR